MGSSQASYTVNKKKVNLLKRKRQQRKNHKAVVVVQKGIKAPVKKPGPSKKKLRKDSKRLCRQAKEEQAKLLVSGLITKEEIETMEQEAEETDIKEESEMKEE